ncbi:uncharacterized protein [Arachis hypogaea]|uniref:uncharacterized protein n=1 Tax=Arachis hypogaea TaxID=3818 RepID=UPI003B20D229
MAYNMNPNIVAFTLTEGQSNNRPPYFNDIPTKQNADGEVVTKEDSKWTYEEKEKVELNAKAINLMHCAISFEEFRKVSSMKEDESIDQMFERFSIIINNLDTMGRNYSEETLVRKILRSLTKKWEVKSTAISERNDLIKITYDELRGKLLAYETTHMSQNKDDKKKSIALKSRMTAQGEESDDSFSDEEMVLFARKMRRLLIYKSKGKGSSSSKDVKKDQVKFTCHHCKEPGHFKSDCPQLKKGEKSKKDKKKVMMATWEDLENDTRSESSDQEAQLCLMADHNDEDEVDLSDLSIDELHYIIKDISVKSKKLLDKYAKCKKENEALRTENDLLLKKVKANETVNYIKLFMILMLLGNQEDFTSKDPNRFGYLSVFLVDGLKHNLLSISQLCDLGYAVTFRKSDCRVINEKTGAVLFVAKRSDNVYGISLDDLKVQNVTCFSSMESEKWMWHKRLGHASMFQISKLVKRGLVRGLPNIKIDKDIICDACQMGKQIKTSFKSKEDVSTKKSLELLHLDLFGPTITQSLGGKSYGMCFILNIKENLGKFDPKTHEGIFLGYSTNSKACRVYNKNSKTVEETMHVTFCKSNNVPSICIDDIPGFEVELPKNSEPVPQNPSSHEVAPVSCENSNSAGDNLELSPVAIENTDAKTIVDQEEPESSTQIKRPREWKFLKNYPEKFIIGDPSKSISTRSSLRRAESNNLALLSKIEPQNIQEALVDPSWVLAMKEKLQQFEKNQILLGIGLIEEAQVACAAFLENLSLFGLAKSKLQWHFQQPKLSILQPPLVVLNYYG